MSEILLEEFKKLELRVAKILDVQEIPGADKLWRLIIDVGSEKKEIVAGVKVMYPKESLMLPTKFILSKKSWPLRQRPRDR